MLVCIQYKTAYLLFIASVNKLYSYTIIVGVYKMCVLNLILWKEHMCTRDTYQKTCWWFQLLKCEKLIIFFVLHGSKKFLI